MRDLVYLARETYQVPAGPPVEVEVVAIWLDPGEPLDTVAINLKIPECGDLASVRTWASPEAMEIITPASQNPMIRITRPLGLAFVGWVLRRWEESWAGQVAELSGTWPAVEVDNGK